MKCCEFGEILWPFAKTLQVYMQGTLAGGEGLVSTVDLLKACLARETLHKWKEINRPSL